MNVILNYENAKEVDNFLKLDRQWVDDNYEAARALLKFDAIVSIWPVEATKLRTRALLGLSNEKSDVAKI